MRKYSADIGIFGGSGFYTFLEGVEEIEIDTPYGKPSDKLAVAGYKGKRVAFLPRHGKDHRYPPHMIPYRANIYAMKELGVSRIIAPSASGSLQQNINPGDFVICDQFIDRTWGRKDTYYDGPITKHISSPSPYCTYLRSLAASACKKSGVRYHEQGTVVVIQGPRFSTIAESRWFSEMGWHVVNMTQYPECILAREAGICYCNISLITDYDAGFEGRKDIIPVTQDEVFRVFAENNDKIKAVLFEMISGIDLDYKGCTC